VIYGICLPLAIFVGYLLATPTDLSSYVAVGVLLCLMMVPLLLRWHYPLLVVSWNMTAGLYFLPGKPSFQITMIGLSFLFSLLAYIMNRNSRFIAVPSITRPLLFITVVVLVTAKLTGSLGLNVLGSSEVGGKRYIFLLCGVIGFFALTAHKIPEQKVELYMKLFFLGGITAAIGNLANLLSPSLYFILLIFPPDAAITSATSVVDTSSQITRLGGISTASVAAISLLLALYGVEGIFNLKKSWRTLLFLLLVTSDLFGGFRSRVIDLMLTLGVLFYMEGLMRSRLLPIIILVMILIGACTLPFADKLPLSIQRSLTFLPLNNLDEEAVMSAKGSTDWRLQMWSNVLPLVPQYLILGKGLGIDNRDLAMMAGGMKGEDSSAGAMLAGDYHSGPLSLIIGFGIFGVIGFVWFLVAGFRVLHKNYLYGDPAYTRINRFLFVYFIVKIIAFIFIYGSFYSDMVIFVGPVGLSIALNGGVRSPEVERVVRPAFNRFRLANAAR
jgi:hypothetical protein